MAPDPKQFVRQWNREIEAEGHRRAAAPEPGRWKLVLWLAFELFWAAVLLALVLWLRRLQW
jgi:hypothetical protein